MAQAVPTSAGSSSLGFPRSPRLQLKISSGDSIRDRLGPAVLLAGRIALGSGLALVLAMFSIGVAWAIFMFSGSQSLATWLVALMFSAGLGAGAGSVLAWLRLDRRNTPVRILTVILVVTAGTLGACIGYDYGSNREIECCAMPTVSPVYYTALGGTLGANVAAVTIALVREFVETRGRTRIQDGVV